MSGPAMTRGDKLARARMIQPYLHRDVVSAVMARLVGDAVARGEASIAQLSPFARLAAEAADEAVLALLFPEGGQG